MPERLLLIDTDMLILLGGSGTLSDVLRDLDFERDHCRRLAAATYQFQRRRSFRDVYSASVLRAAHEIANGIAPLHEQPTNNATLDALARISDIDLGEAQLIALLAERRGYYLTTGDKRALVALTANEEVAALRHLVAGRIICLESILKLLVRRNGAKATAEAFRTLRTHRTISVLLSDPQVRTDGVCLQGIDSYLNDLILKTGEGFLFLPEVAS